jgi:hypothetical protein
MKPKQHKPKEPDIPLCPHSQGGVECELANTEGCHQTCGWHPEEVKRRAELLRDNGLAVLSYGLRLSCAST